MKRKLNQNVDQCLFGRYHVLDLMTDELTEHQSLENLRVIDVSKSEVDRDGDQIFRLIDGVVLKYEENFKVHLASGNYRIYLPVYDVQNAVDEAYSFYLEEDLIGFIDSGFTFDWDSDK